MCLEWESLPLLRRLAPSPGLAVVFEEVKEENEDEEEMFL